MPTLRAKPLQQLYTPRPSKPMHVVVFGSGSGTNLEALLRASKRGDAAFKVSAIFTDRKCRCHEIAEKENIPLLYVSFKNFSDHYKASGAPENLLRNEYDRTVATLLNDASEEHGFTVDLIFLAGYMRLVTTTLLEAFPNKIINIHPSDLTALDSEGNRRYVGIDAVYDALANGETRTRSSVILVDETMDGGPILVSGPWVDFPRGQPVTRESVSSHQDKQKVQSDWPASIAAIELIAKGRMAVDGDRNIYCDEAPLRASGYVVEHYEE